MDSRPPYESARHRVMAWLPLSKWFQSMPRLCSAAANPE